MQQKRAAQQTHCAANWPLAVAAVVVVVVPTQQAQQAVSGQGGQLLSH